MNILNELAGMLGPVYEPALYIGGISMFGAPILAFLATKGVFVQGASGTRRTLKMLGSGAAVFAGVLWVVALLALFPGILFCSMYCFLGLALPLLGLATAACCLLLIAGAIGSKGNAQDA